MHQKAATKNQIHFSSISLIATCIVFLIFPVRQLTSNSLMYLSNLQDECDLLVSPMS